MDRVRNGFLIERCGSRKSLSNRLDHSILISFGHIEMTDEGRLIREIYGEELKVARLR